MQLVLNAITGKFDIVGMTSAEVSAYLKLDQTTPQTVINGAPIFNVGVELKDDSILTSDKKFYLDGL